MRPAASATQTHTVPTGFSSEPPPGPATPVIATPIDVPSARRTPSAIASATSWETAPTRSISSAGTPASAVLASLA